MKRIILLLLLTYSTSILYAQESSVTGRVVDENSDPVPGATIKIKGTSTGTVTDLDGNWRLNAPKDATLTISFLGMKTIEVEVGNQSVLNVALEDDTEQLKEVVVVGYGTQLKQDVTGTIAKVSGKELENIPVNSFESAMQGRASGVLIEKGSGKLGEAIKVRVRGTSSISGNNQPLYVIDGIPITAEDQGITNNQPTNPLSDINFSDIESVEVLKDAYATAIYGSRGSNGVVIITTKRGSTGRPKINLGFQTGVSSPTRLREWLNAEEYRELYTEATLRYLGYDPITATPEQIVEAQVFLDDDTGLVAGFSDTESATDVDWQDQAFNDDAGFTQFDLSMTGGTETTKYYAGITQSDQSGILINNNFKRRSIRLNLDQEITDKLDIGLGVNFVESELDRVSNDNAFSTPIQMVALAPTQPARLEDGTPNPNTIYYNGLIQSENAQNTTTVYRTLGNVKASYELIPGLKITSEYGLDVLNQREDGYQGRETQDGSPTGLGSSRNVRVVNSTFTNVLSLSKIVGDHSINALAGTSTQESERQITSVSASGFPTDDLNTIASAAENTFQTSSVTGFAFLSYFARADYKFKNRYLLGLSARIDGSSKFGSDSQYGTYPAASAGWIVSEEAFLKNQSTLSYLKLRTSYGLTGNTPTANFGARGKYEGAAYTNNPGLRIFSLENPDLSWESTAQFNFGLDFGVLSDRITGEVDYYIKNTRDLLLSAPLPAVSGVTSYLGNSGKLENRGLEIVINSENLVGDFRWSTNFNIAFNRNKITKLNNDSDITAGVNRAREGEDIGVFVSREWAGVNPENGDALYYVNREVEQSEIDNGTVLKVDHLGDRYVTASYNSAENVVIGSPNPDFIGGINNTMSYKGFDLGFFFQFIYGNEIYNNGGQYQSNNASGFVDNQTRDQLNRWRQPGDITDVPRAELVGGIGTQASSRYLSDGSYLRLKTVTLGYNLPQSLLEKIRLRSARVYVSGQNLMTWTKYKGWDPEITYTGTNRTQTSANLIQGVDFYTVPQAKTITAGINIGL